MNITMVDYAGLVCVDVWLNVFLFIKKNVLKREGVPSFVEMARITPLPILRNNDEYCRFKPGSEIMIQSSQQVWSSAGFPTLSESSLARCDVFSGFAGTHYIRFAGQLRSPREAGDQTRGLLHHALTFDYGKHFNFTLRLRALRMTLIWLRNVEQSLLPFVGAGENLSEARRPAIFGFPTINVSYIQ